MKSMSRIQFKDADLYLLDKYILSEDIDNLREFFDTWRFSNVFMFRGQGGTF